MTTRRSFLSWMLKIGAAFAILPGAVSYARTWKRTENLWVLNPEWEKAPLELVCQQPDFTVLRYPLRFYYGKDGQLMQIPPFKQITDSSP